MLPGDLGSSGHLKATGTCDRTSHLSAVTRAAAAPHFTDGAGKECPGSAPPHHLPPWRPHQGPCQQSGQPQCGGTPRMPPLKVRPLQERGCAHLPSPLPSRPASLRPWATSLCRRHSDRAAQNKHRADRFPLSDVWEPGKREQKYPARSSAEQWLPLGAALKRAF